MMCVRKLVQRLRESGTSGEELQKRLKEQSEALKQVPVTQVKERNHLNIERFSGGSEDSIEFCVDGRYGTVRQVDERIWFSLISCFSTCLLLPL